MHYTAKYWIDKLQLTEHVEGGSFSEVYRSPVIMQQQHIPAFPGNRNILTSIYFLLEQGQFSAFHRIRSDELWHFYYGDALDVFELQENGQLIIHSLGSEPELDQEFQCVIKAGNWFASAPKAGSEYSLCGCTVSPGFDFADFELGDRNSLISHFPQHNALITSLTR